MWNVWVTVMSCVPPACVDSQEEWVRCSIERVFLFCLGWQLHHSNYTIAQLVEHCWSQAMGPWFESRWCSWFFHSNIFPGNIWKNWFPQIPRTLIINIAHWGSPHSGFYVKCVGYSWGLRPTGLCGFTGRVSLMFEWKGLSVLSGLTTTL